MQNGAYYCMINYEHIKHVDMKSRVMAGDPPAGKNRGILQSQKEGR